MLLSSAAVTRPEWNEEQRNSFPEAYGIPIVQLNPEGILNYKLKGERVSHAGDLNITWARTRCIW